MLKKAFIAAIIVWLILIILAVWVWALPGLLDSGIAPGGSGSEVVVTFDTPGASTWTVPTGVTVVKIEVWGGGGSGGGWGCCASGGGGGGYSRKNALSVTPGQVISYIVAAGGASPGDATGNAGSPFTTVIDGTWGADGGSGGNNSGGGDPGGAAGGDVNTTGNIGSPWPTTNAGGAGGDAANAPGTGGLQGNPGTPALSPGGGGTGGGFNSPNGLAGAPGRVRFTYTAP